MICSLMLDPDDSIDFPGNQATALGRPIAAYPLMAAKASRHIRRHYVITESPPVKAVALQYGAVIIDPPPHAGSSPRSESLLRHGFRFIREELNSDTPGLELLVVLFSHAPAVTSDILDQGIEALQAGPELDSAVSVSPHNRFNPFCAKRETSDGLMEPYVPYSSDARGDVWYPDWGVQIVRAASLEAETGGKPFSWLGKKVLPLKQWGGGPIDYLWQIPSVEYWLKKHGVSDQSSSLELQPKPKPQAAPKGRA